MNDSQRADAGGTPPLSISRTRGRPRITKEDRAISPMDGAATNTSGRGNVNLNLPPSQSTSARELTGRGMAERAREKKLRDDPMAEVHGPLYVTCKRCGGRIKLSPKSTYDPFHWQKHRERCLKKPAGVVKEMKRRAKELYNSTAKDSPTSSSKTGGDSVTPPLVPDDDDDISSPGHVKEESPSPQLDDNLSSSTRALFSRPPDLAFEEYLFRSRRKMTRELSPPAPDGWQSWSWDQLKAPVWVVASYPDQPEADGENEIDDREEASLTLSEATTAAELSPLHPADPSPDSAHPMPAPT